MFSSCDRTDDFSIYNYNGDEQTYFTDISLVRTLVITPETDPNILITVGSTNVSDTDRTYNIEIDPSSTATSGVEFNLPSSTATIPAGEYTTSFVVSTIFDGLSESGSTLKLNLVGASEFSNQVSLTLFKVCPYNESNFTGDYKVVEDEWADYGVGDLVPVEGQSGSVVHILSTNNPYIGNPDTSYMILTIDETGECVVTSNEPFDYGGPNQLAVTGSGSVNLCNGDIDISIAFGPYGFYQFTLTPNF